jgi:hypothetical protein
METSTQNGSGQVTPPTGVTNINAGKKGATTTMKFSVFDIQTIQQILNMRTGQGATIKDIRVIDAVVLAMKKALPEPPAPPTMRAIKEGDAPHTEEEKKAFQQEALNYNVTMQAFSDQEVEVELTTPSLALIKQRLQGFSGYFTDEDARKKIISLADKLGL